MHFIDILTLSLSILGVHDLILYLRFLLPHNVIPRVAAPLNEVQQLLNRAQSIGAIPYANEYAATLERYEFSSLFAAVRPLTGQIQLRD